MTDADARTWIAVAGYQHEKVHSGVLWALLDDPVIGPKLAAQLTNWPVAEVIDTHRERRIARATADLVANVRLADGAERVLAVETKVHSNGSREQLARTTEGRDDAAGVLLALGFTGLKMSRWDTDEVGEAGAAWAFVDAAAWLELLGSVEQAPHWLPPYRDAVEQWSTWLAAGRGPLDDRMATELEHLRWFADLRPHLHRPGKWQPVVTRQSGPLLSLFAWGEPGADVYLEAMGFWRSGRRRLHLKVGGDPSNVGPLRERMLSVVEHVPELRPARGRFREGHRSASIAVHEYEDATPAEAARVTNRMEGALDALVGRD